MTNILAGAGIDALKQLIFRLFPSRRAVDIGLFRPNITAISYSSACHFPIPNRCPPGSNNARIRSRRQIRGWPRNCWTECAGSFQTQFLSFGYLLWIRAASPRRIAEATAGSASELPPPQPSPARGGGSEVLEKPAEPLKALRRTLGRALAGSVT